jgi:probable rRNA maturation factor
MPTRRRDRGPRPAPVTIDDVYRPRSDVRLLRRVIAAARREIGRPRLAVAVRLTGEREIARLHGRFLGVRRGTDVLSFHDGNACELVVSVERARARARQLGHSIRAELALYVVHGILHCGGHDDAAPRARARMRDAEQRVLGRLGLRVPRF